MRKKKTISALPLNELFVLTGVLAVFIVISIATYFHYKIRFYYRQQVVNVATKYRILVTGCIKNYNGQLIKCNPGSEAIPIKPASKSVTINIKNGIITITPAKNTGINHQHTYILTPTYHQNRVKWTASGGGCEAGIAPNC